MADIIRNEVIDAVLTRQTIREYKPIMLTNARSHHRRRGQRVELSVGDHSSVYLSSEISTLIYIEE